MDITLESYSTAGATMTSNCSQIVETHGSSFYITIYSTKKQNWIHNLLAIMAKGYAYHMEHSCYLEDARDNHHLLLFWLVHAINWEQEIAAPMVCSHLKGWGEKYCSHSYHPYIGLHLWESSFKHFLSFVRGMSHHLIGKLQTLMVHFSKAASHEWEVPESRSDHRQ